MAAVTASLDLPSHDAVVDLSSGTSTSVDVEISVYGALDPATQELIDNVKGAIDKLHNEYGIEAVFAPSIVYWDVSVVFPVFGVDIPVLVINGREVARGHSLSVDEIVEATLALLGVKESEKVVPILSKRSNKMVQAASVTW